jgi:hypothetical protein
MKNKEGDMTGRRIKLQFTVRRLAFAVRCFQIRNPQSAIQMRT